MCLHKGLLDRIAATPIRDTFTHRLVNEPAHEEAVGAPERGLSRKEGSVLGHLGLNVPDLRRAKEYYDQIMPALGFETFLSHDDEFAYCPAGGKRGTYIFFYPAETTEDYIRGRAGLQHLAFMVKTRTAVHEMHGLAVGLGAEIVHEPREFPEYTPPYYATFWRDPFGFMLEAVCHYDRP